MRILKRIVIFFGIVFLSLIIASAGLFFYVRQLKIKEMVEHEIEQSLGINVTIDKIEFSPLLAHIGLTGITVHNPPGFAEGELAYIDWIHFVCDPLEILIQKKPNIYVFGLSLKRLNVVKNKDGRINLKELLAANNQTPFHFGVVVLNVGDVRYIDYSEPAPREHIYHIDIKEATFVRLKNEDEVVRMIIYKAIANTDIGKLINLHIVPIVSQIGDTLDAAWTTAKSGAKGAWEIATLPFSLVFGK